jgi:hypothetical protein
LERLQDDIFSILERAAPKTLIDERLNFRSGDLNGHGSHLLLLHYHRLPCSNPTRFGRPRKLNTDEAQVAAQLLAEG